jgi:uncharacterized glyoxalase superfamily protein PhnB
MSDRSGTTIATVIPTLRYRDAPAAIAFLCKAFGFEKHLVVPGVGDTIAHAQLRLGHGMIMLGSADKSVHDDEYGRLMRVPREIDGANTQSAYVIVADCDAHYARAKAGGAVIVLDIKDQDYGGRGYTCRDPEGHLWSFGSYDPWAEV